MLFQVLLIFVALFQQIIPANHISSSPKTVPLSYIKTSGYSQKGVGDSMVLGVSQVAKSSKPAITALKKSVLTSATATLPEQILQALNLYRAKKGKPDLLWDQKLGDYASSRALYFSTIGKLDDHIGFKDFMNNQGGFTKLGFFALGENSSWATNMPTPTDLIEKQYASDKLHDDNQLNSEWQYVGIGASGNFTDLVFGGKKQ